MLPVPAVYFFQSARTGRFGAVLAKGGEACKRPRRASALRDEGCLPHHRWCQVMVAAALWVAMAPMVLAWLPVLMLMLLLLPALLLIVMRQAKPWPLGVYP